MSFPFTPAVMRRGRSKHVNEDNAMPSRPQPRTPTLDAHPLQHTTASVMLAIAWEACRIFRRPPPRRDVERNLRSL